MKHLKQEFDKLTFKETVVYSMAFLSLVTGFVLLFIGMFTEPRGQIHESVLTAFGVILIFVGSLMGISMHYANELTHFKGVVTNMLNSHGQPGKEARREAPASLCAQPSDSPQETTQTKHQA